MNTGAIIMGIFGFVLLFGGAFYGLMHMRLDSKKDNSEK